MQDTHRLRKHLFEFGTYFVVAAFVGWFVVIGVTALAAVITGFHHSWVDRPAKGSDNIGLMVAIGLIATCSYWFGKRAAQDEKE
jgi:hypothetical protein